MHSQLGSNFLALFFAFAHTICGTENVPAPTLQRYASPFSSDLTLPLKIFRNSRFLFLPMNDNKSPFLFSANRFALPKMCHM
uniref:Putative secreted protein n=1 Tax=Ixodes ricinus TaxID=34613 RepID=A0A6B0TWW5_IXORI